MILMKTDSFEAVNEFKVSYESKRQHNIFKAVNEKRPVASQVEDWFEPADGIKGIFVKSWLRTDYYWDRYFVHTPFCIYRRLRAKRTPYLYQPLSLSSDQVSESEHENSIVYNPTDSLDVLENEENFQDKSLGFKPKPYLLNSESIRDVHKKGKLVSQETHFEAPSLTKMFEQVKETSPGFISKDLHSPQSMSKQNHGGSPKQLKDTTFPTSQALNYTRPETSEIPITSNGILCKIKIRKHHPQLNPIRQSLDDKYEAIRRAIRDTLPQPDFEDKSLGPNMVRFTWHCCAHYDQVTGTGGSNGGTMRFAQEFNDPGNTGLHTAKSYLDQIHEKFTWISFADLYTLGGVVAIEEMGGPKITWLPGRTDCPDAAKVPPIGRLPLATLGVDHIHTVFTQRLGFNDQEIVALIGGGHTLGGCHAKFSGFTGKWTQNPLIFDNQFFKVLLEKQWSLGTVPETGKEQYYSEDKLLMMLITDIHMLRHPKFREWVEIYAKDCQRFLDDFAKAFAKLIELGVIRDADGVARVKQ
ncbi:hypothetical protein CANARDRAFT_177696 [[Candida] arabinofermentans NRRL YB-2248]|uniref:Peroxidase n=1 Tax=[Candida] arabinofermentans NRRL YB-2248 TaxID=983967 RepID=A0A1E4SVM9_9ASCO|nr:hypothetical protein CANARDRAFT_177696 [[Candida] arabinofermentans NRRL YB-2248]